jgi:hypothetical protein
VLSYAPVSCVWAADPVGNDPYAKRRVGTVTVFGIIKPARAVGGEGRGVLVSLESDRLPAGSRGVTHAAGPTWPRGQAAKEQAEIRMWVFIGALSSLE